MKKLTINSLALASLLALGAVAQAQTVGVQFAPYYSTPYNTLNGSKYGGPDLTMTAGVASQDNWNVAEGGTGGGDGAVLADITNANLLAYIVNPGAGVTPYPNNGPYIAAPTTNLIDSTGATSSVLFDVSGPNVQRGGLGSSIGGTSGNLVSGGAFNTGGSSSLSLAGLNATDNYTLYIYTDADYNFYGGGTVDVSLGTKNYYFTMVGSGSLTSYTQGTATSAAAGATDVADYVKFTGTGLQLETDSAIIHTAGVGFAGFQLVDNAGNAAVPEPSTVWLFALGFAGLVFQIQRKRLAKS